MSAISNLNYVRKVFRHPCGTPNIPVLVETALPAAAMALVEVFTFGCTDILKMRLGRKPWHSRGLSALIKKKYLGVKYGPALHGFLIPFAPIEAALQYMLFADAATGFIANWMSLIYQEQRCTLPGAGYLRAPLSSLFAGAGQHQVLINALDSRPCCAIGGNVITIPRGCTATITFTTRFEPFLNLQANRGSIETWLEEIGSGKKFSVQPGQDQPNGHSVIVGGAAEVRSSAYEFDKQYRIQYRQDRGLMGCVEGSLSVSSYGRPMSLVPAGCVPKFTSQPYPTPEPPPTPQAIENKKRVALAFQNKAKPKLKKQPKPPKKKKKPKGPKPGHGSGH